MGAIFCFCNFNFGVCLSAGAIVPGGGVGAQCLLVLLDTAAVLVAPHEVQGRGSSWH